MNGCDPLHQRLELESEGLTDIQEIAEDSLDQEEP
jgi:hypothetical protein